MLYAILLSLVSALVLVAIIALLGRVFRNHRKGLILALGVLWVGSWVIHGITEWQSYTHDQETHKQQVDFTEFAGDFYRASFENIQSEYLQLFSFVTLATALVAIGSSESKDSDDRIEENVNRIAAHLGVETVDEEWTMKQQ